MYKLCKTEQSALRQKQMEQGLLEYMRTHRYEDITIIELCKFLQIPRKSFYRYFDSKDGALFALIDHTFMEFEGYHPPYPEGSIRTMERELTGFFHFWADHRAVLDVLEKSGLSGILLERSTNHMRQMSTINRFLSSEPEFLRSYISNFSVSGLMIMMVNWHHEGYQLTPKEMARIATRLLSKPLFPNMEQFF